MMRWQYIAPVVVVVVIMGLLGYGLTRNPNQLPSVLIGRSVPDFSLATLASDDETITNEALKGQVTMVNIWASWCVVCRAEQPLIAELAMQTGVPIVGIDFKDTRPAAQQWLNRFGNPFATIVFDQQGQLGFDLGVSGVPETFIVDADGVIRHKVVGPVTPQIIHDTVLPLIQRLKQET